MTYTTLLPLQVYFGGNFFFNLVSYKNTKFLYPTEEYKNHCCGLHSLQSYIAMFLCRALLISELTLKWSN